MKIAILLVTLAIVPGSLVADEIRIAGTGASQRMLREIASVFEREVAGCEASVPDSIGSRGGVRAVASGHADLARVSRSLKSRARDSGLENKVFATTQVVFAAHPSVVGVERISVEQLIAIYGGDVSRWSSVGGPDAPIFPLIRDGGTTLRTVMKFIPEFEPVPAHAKPTYSSLETVELLLEHPYTFGMLPMTLLAGTPLKVIGIDGVTPVGLVLEPDGPHMSLPLGLVYPQRVTSCARSFLEFVDSDTARAVIRANYGRPSQSAGP